MKMANAILGLNEMVDIEQYTKLTKSTDTWDFIWNTLNRALMIRKVSSNWRICQEVSIHKKKIFKIKYNASMQNHKYTISRVEMRKVFLTILRLQCRVSSGEVLGSEQTLTENFVCLWKGL